MKPIKFTILLFFLGVFLCLPSCSQLRYTSPDAPEWAVGVLNTDKAEKVRIASVDGKKAAGTLGGKPVGEFPDSVNLFPGFHTIGPCYMNPAGVIYGDVLSFYTQAEKVYTLRHKIKWNKTIKFWVECNGVNITTE